MPHPVPPAFSELNRPVRDLFSRGYNPGLFKLDWKTSTDSGMRFSLAGAQDIGGGKTTGSVEGVYSYKNFTIKEKWSTDNEITLDLGAEDRAKGAHGNFVTKYSPYSGDKSAVLKVGVKQNGVNFTGDVDLQPKGPKFTVGTAFAHDCGVRGGLELIYDVAKSSLTKNTVAFGWNKGRLTAYGALSNLTNYEIGFHNNVSDQLDAGAMVNYAQGSPAVTLSAAMKYDLDDLSTLRAKIDNKGFLGLGLAHKFNKGMTANFSMMVNTRHFNQGGHQLGFGFDLNA